MAVHQPWHLHMSAIHHAYVTHISHVHHAYITCTSHIHHAYISRTSRIHHAYISCTSYIHQAFLTPDLLSDTCLLFSGSLYMSIVSTHQSLLWALPQQRNFLFWSWNTINYCSVMVSAEDPKDSHYTLTFTNRRS